MPKLIDRQIADPKKPFIPFDSTGNQPVPDFLPIGGDQLVRQTSSTHGPDGYITTDPKQIARNQERLEFKIKSAAHQFTYHDRLDVADADTLVIAYGVTARAARVAVKQLARSDRRASLLVLKTLWPVPEELIRGIAEDYWRIVVVEMNLGQYLREIERILPDKKIDFLGQMNGELIKPGQIQEVIQNG